WVLVIENIKGGRPVVGVDYHLHTIAQVVEAIVVQKVMSRVGVVVGGGERVHHPVQAAVLAHHDVGVRLVGKKRCQSFHTRAHIAAHQQPAAVVHVVAEGQLGEITARGRDQNTPQPAA